METLRCCRSLHGYIAFLFLAAISKASSCEAPSCPECFRRNASESVYMCEWSMNTTESGVTFDLYFNDTKFENIKKTFLEVTEERLIQNRPVNIWVEAHGENFSCSSPRSSVVLKHIVKYEAPQNIKLSWLKNNLNLTWKAAEEHQALAEVWFRQDGRPTESWEKILINTTMLTALSPAEVTTSVKKQLTREYQVIVENLLKHSSYQVQIRQRSTQALNPLWSKWSPVVLVPAELEHKPEVNITTKLLNGTREVTLTWEPVAPAAAAGGVTYLVGDTQSSQGCPCKTKTQRHRHTNSTIAVTYVSYSAVNISIIARNLAGDYHSALIHLPVQPAADLKGCANVTLDDKLKKKSCRQWYEVHDQGSRVENEITLTSKKKYEREQVRKSLRDFVRYLYFEHICEDGKPRTVQMCLFYKKQGGPLREPQDLSAFNCTHTSAVLSWKPMPSEHLRGFFTHYNMCRVKISSHVENEECYKISASLLSYRLENMTPGAKYNISLAAVTQAGEGPKVTLTINTMPDKQVNVWLSFGLLIAFFLGTTMCTAILKRIKIKLFPPVPKPVIADFSFFQPENQQEAPESKEEVNDLMLLLPNPRVKSVPEDAGETSILRVEWGDGAEGDEGSDGADSRMSGGSGDESPDSTDQVLKSSRDRDMTEVEQLDDEIALLIYRNGLVFDVKPDSP